MIIRPVIYEYGPFHPTTLRILTAYRGYGLASPRIRTADLGSHVRTAQYMQNAKPTAAHPASNHVCTYIPAIYFIFERYRLNITPS